MPVSFNDLVKDCWKEINAWTIIKVILYVLSYEACNVQLCGHFEVLNESVLILSDLELPGMPYVAPITGISEAISGCQNVNYIMCTKLFGGLVGR